MRGFSRESVQAAVDKLTGMLGEAQQRAAEAERHVAELRAERDRLAQELQQYKTIEHSLAQTLALAEETARVRQQQAEDEAQRLLGEARTNASEAAENAIAEVSRIREELVGVIGAIDGVLTRRYSS
jgi:cell division septum initiation protein DivIVA